METENFSETILSIDNSEGLVPFLTKEVKSSFEFPDKLMWERGLNPSSVLDGGIDTVASSCDTLFQQKELIQELKASNFKVAIVDLLYNECGLALAHYLGLPVVAYWAISFVSGEIQYTTAFNPPSSIPHIYFPYTEMNFLQRCLNFIFAICNHILMQDIEEFIENSNEEVILLSLGRNFDPKSLPKEVFEVYFSALGELKQKVIVKSKSSPASLPPNVKVMGYVPQADILAHPRTTLFISHCGLHGVMEAIHYGVKMVTVPIFFDQGNVARRLVDKGVAISLSKTATKAVIKEAILEVLHNASYENNMKRMSALYHSSMNSPMDRALWLIEHVMNTDGASYLKLKAKDFNTFQYFCLDVVLFFVFITVTVFYVLLRWERIKRRFVKKQTPLKHKKS
ncbi:UDP-glucuronosyltransferase 2C1 [Armadillidium nasatum]|uniref:UDP-glucuronosyltransferase 2C1 n=1 Tax=Armadillidium nasatum TaxID=96803 RepID=A0A5N5T555_9CRUS|nr:UDP-glucuronosyltransferase 2C1 [Armadillidium nasatum]